MTIDLDPDYIPKRLCIKCIFVHPTISHSQIKCRGLFKNVLLRLKEENRGQSESTASTSLS